MATKGGNVEEVGSSETTRSHDRGCEHHPTCLGCPFSVCKQDSNSGNPSIKLTDAFERGVHDRFLGISMTKSSYARKNPPVRRAWTKGWWSADRWVRSRDLSQPIRVQLVANMLGIHVNTVRRLDGNELHSFRVGPGGHRRFKLKEVLDYMERKKGSPSRATAGGVSKPGNVPV